MGKSLLMGSVALAVTAFGLGSVAKANPVSPAWEFGSENINFTNNDWNFGNQFEARNYVAGYLGYYDDFGDGFLNGQTHEVKLYDNGGVLLRQATVSSADPLLGHFRYAKIAPIALTGTYWVHGQSGTDNYTWNTNGFFTDPRISYIGNTWVVGGSADYLGFLVNDVDDGYWGPNLAAVPEPASWALMLVGFGLVGATIRRRKSAVVTA